MKQITKEDLIDLLINFQKASPATIIAFTKVKMNKKDNPYFDRITKIIVANVFLNFKYINSVNNQRIKENKDDNFIPHERRWGERIKGTTLVKHKNEYYVECRFLKVAKVTYLLENDFIDKNIIEEFLPETYSNNIHQGLEKEHEVIIRDFKIDSIKEIKFQKEHYIII